MRGLIYIFLVLTAWQGLSACALTKAVDEYDEKECEEIRKIAQEDFLSGQQDGSLRPHDDSDIADAFFRRRVKPSDTKRQGRRLSYKQRCR